VRAAHDDCRKVGEGPMIASYDAIAEWYDTSVTQGGPFFQQAVLDLVGAVGGKQLCDLACGQGIVARELARRSARVTGIDLSAGLLDIARRYEEDEPLGVQYRQGDAQVLATITDGSFDGVTCNLALMDIPDPAAVFRAAHRITRAGGWFVFSIIHPCFFPPDSLWVTDDDGDVSRKVLGYFSERFWHSYNPAGVRGQVGAHHRMLSTYLNLLVETGWQFERSIEPQGTGKIADRVPGYAEVPVMLAIRCGKPER
jgi:ubiquinone/menaquinone biosynthesis C-methylase UbiE